MWFNHFPNYVKKWFHEILKVSMEIKLLFI
jgi:hypothetical protein